MTNFTNSYNFTQGNELLGSGLHTNNTSIYDFSIDLQLITCILIIIMLCQIAQMGFLFLKTIGWLK